MKIVFTTIFLISLLIFEFLGFEDWFFISVIIQVVWLNLNSNSILSFDYSNFIWANRIRNLNKITLVILVLDLIIIYLSTSFIVRVFLAPFYRSLYILTLLLIFLSAIINYYILIKTLMQMPISRMKKMIFILVSFFYPIGVFVINIRRKENFN